MRTAPRPTSRSSTTAAWADPETRRRRPPAPDLHLLPSGAGARRADRADAARSLRPDDGRDRARVPDAGAHARAAHRPREGKDPRRADSVSGARAGGAARAARRGAARHLSRLQRGLRRFVGRSADAPRSLRRSDPPRAAARRTAAGAGSGRTARADAAARIAARGAHVTVRRAGPARRSGPLAVGPRADRRRIAPRDARRSRRRRFGPYTLQAAIAAVHAEAPTPAATDWAGDRRPLRRAAANGRLAGRRAQPRGRGRDARRSGGRARLRRRDPRTRRPARLPPRACGARGVLPPARPDEGGPRILRAGAALTRQEPERRFLERRLAEIGP